VIRSKRSDWNKVEKDMGLFSSMRNAHKLLKLDKRSDTLLRELCNFDPSIIPEKSREIVRDDHLMRMFLIHVDGHHPLNESDFALVKLAFYREIVRSQDQLRAQIEEGILDLTSTIESFHVAAIMDAAEALRNLGIRPTSRGSAL
jgi:hypothetical protein